MDNPKQTLRMLIAQNDLAALFPLFLTHTQTAGLEALNNRVLLQQARFGQLNADQNTGIIDYDDIARNRIAITQALLNLVDQLPSAGTLDKQLGKKSKPRGIKESVLKRQIFISLVAVKVYIVGYILTLWQAGTFPLMEFLTLTGIVTTLFATYLTVIFRDIAQHRYVDSPLDNRLVRRSFQWSAFLLLGLYVIVLQIVIDLYGRGDLTEFSQLSATITGVEGGLGVYLGQLIFSLFKKEAE
jgi:hypothetical protein